MTFYTYLWLREDGSPYYVGKGHGKRAFRKGSPSRNRIVIHEWVDEATAFAFEIYQIDFWGRKDNGTGILRNRTDGGEGLTGQIISDEARKKMSVAKKGKPLSIKHRQKMQKSQRQRFADPLQRQKVSAALMGNTHRRGQTLSLETRKKMGEARKGNTNGLGNCSNLGRKLSSEQRNRISRFMKENGKSFWTPERRAMQAERMRQIRQKAVEVGAK